MVVTWQTKRKEEEQEKWKSNRGGKSCRVEVVNEELRDGENVQRDGDDTDLESA